MHEPSANRTEGAGRRRFRLPRASTWFALVIAIHGVLQLTLGVARLVAPDVVLIQNDSGDEVSGLARILIGFSSCSSPRACWRVAAEHGSPP